MMLTVLFLIALIWFLWKVIVLAVKATWGLAKIGFYVIFFPLVLVGLVLGGLVYIALPLAIIGGIIALVVSK